MAYVDKLCACCGKYVHPTEEQFKISNICLTCIENKAAQNIHIISFKDSYDKSYTTNRKRSYMGFHWVYWFNSVKATYRLVHSDRIGLATYGKSYPMFYDIDIGGPDTPLVTNRDIRKLRRTLRMLGVTGKIEQYIK